MDKVTHEVRCKQWTQIIKECLASGMNNKTAWYKAHGISSKSFFYWQRILRNEAYIDQKQLPAFAFPEQEAVFDQRIFLFEEYAASRNFGLIEVPQDLQF